MSDTKPQPVEDIEIVQKCDHTLTQLLKPCSSCNRPREERCAVCATVVERPAPTNELADRYRLVHATRCRHRWASIDDINNCTCGVRKVLQKIVDLEKLVNSKVLDV